MVHVSSFVWTVVFCLLTTTPLPYFTIVVVVASSNRNNNNSRRPYNNNRPFRDDENAPFPPPPPPPNNKEEEDDYYYNNNNNYQQFAQEENDDDEYYYKQQEQQQYPPYYGDKDDNTTEPPPIPLEQEEEVIPSDEDDDIRRQQQQQPRRRQGPPNREDDPNLKKPQRQLMRVEEEEPERKSLFRSFSLTGRKTKQKETPSQPPLRLPPPSQRQQQQRRGEPPQQRRGKPPQQRRGEPPQQRRGETPSPQRQQSLPGMKRPPSESSYEPIHYDFPSTDLKPLRSSEGPGEDIGPRRRIRRDDGVDDDGIPTTVLDRPINDPRRRGNNIPQYASPRRDIIARYMSSTKGRLALTISSSTFGTAIGIFIGKSLFNQPKLFSFIFGIFFFICTFLRNPYGELVRALGIGLILCLQRTRMIRKKYYTWPHIQACIQMRPRRPFPPLPLDDSKNENPWTYKPNHPRDIRFNMMYCILAMAFIGSTCGGNLPLIPTWMGGIGGAALFAVSTTMKSARGDLARTMGMRVVALCEEALYINKELKIINKFGVVSGRVFDKIMFLDRKHRIKDRIVTILSWGYDKISGTVSQVQNDIPL